jgi:beta-fructofuranosidase
VGNRPADGSGQLLLFTSRDGFAWAFKSILAKNENRFGKMWECPDLFQLDGKWVILTSPQDMMPEGFEYHNGNGTLCLIGEYDKEGGTFAEERNQSIDYGIDFYAPQTILTPDGRRVMIGWMQNWDTCNFHKPEKPWFGQMSLPRELSIRNGRLIQNPIRELEALRAEKVSYDNVNFSGELRLDKIRGRKIDLTVTVRPKDESQTYHKFEVVFAENENYRSHISFRPYEQIVKIDRKFSGSRRAIIHQRRCFTGSGEDGRIKMRIILDNFSAEVFVNDGEQVLSATLYTDLAADGILFFADGQVSMDVVSYELNM